MTRSTSPRQLSCDTGNVTPGRAVCRFIACFSELALVLVASGICATAADKAIDVLKEIQTAYVHGAKQKAHRVYHFGSQGSDDIFSNHTSHSNRLVPVYVFGRNAKLGSVTGENSLYRDTQRIKSVYGFLPENTLNSQAVYADQSDLYKVQKDAVALGVKHLFIVWFDGLDWPTTQAAAIVRTGKVYTEGKGSGLLFQDYNANGTAQYGFVVTSPTHDENQINVDRQTIVIPPTSMGGGYDSQIAGENPWSLGPLGARAPGYLKGQSASPLDVARVTAIGRVLHAYTDSSQSAAEMLSGVKAYNNGLNVRDDGRLVTTLFHELQERGWKVGTVTSVPFNHASPAAMYDQNVYRDDYQDIARAMLGLPGILQEVRQAPLRPGLDVVIGTGHGIITNPKSLALQGQNGVIGNLFITDQDLATVDVKNGGKYVVVHTEKEHSGDQLLSRAASQAAADSRRLFGFFGRTGLDHLPYQTTDGRYDPAPSLDRRSALQPAESYTDDDRLEQPTLAQMATAAITVLGAKAEQPFALFIEAGDVDFALHSNNLDNAIGAIYSGEEAVRMVVRWVEAHSNWDESLLIVSSDHGHYLVLDDPGALARAK